MLNFISGVHGWMLKLNSDEPEFMSIGDKHTRESLIPTYPVMPSKHHFSGRVSKKSGCHIFHSGNSFEYHTAKVCHAC